MADTLVLAELSIDSSGVVTGVAVAGGALDNLNRKTEDTGKKSEKASALMGALTGRMFSLRSAAVALLGSFTLAGLILQISNLTANLITGTDWWKKWSGAATDAFNALVKGEGVMERTARHLSEAQKGTGVIFGITRMEDVQKIVAAQETAMNELMAIPRGPTGRSTNPLLDRNLRQGIDDLTRALQKIQQQSGLTEGAFDLLFGTHLTDAVVQATRLTEGFDDTLQRTHAPVSKAVKLTGDWNEELQHAGNFLRDLNVPLKENFFLLEQWEAAIDLLNHQMDELANPGRSVKLKDAAEKWEQLGEAAFAAMDALSQAAAAGVVSQSVAARASMALVAVLALIKGKFEVAEAAAAAAKHDYLSATLHGVAAGLYFATAAFNVAGAVRGATGAGSGGSGGFAAAQESREPTVVHNYYISGVVGNEAALVRWISDAQRRGERTGG